MKLISYEALIIGESITFMYDKIHIPGVSLERIPYALVSKIFLENIFFRNIGVKIKQEKIDETDGGWNYLKEKIDNNIPVLFKIDGRFLDNGNIERVNKFVNLQYLSTLLLVGYTNDKALVVLTNTDEKDMVTEINISDIQKYRISKCNPISPDGLCYYLDNYSGIEKVTDKKIKESLFLGLRNITNTMLNDKEECVSLGSFEGIGTSFGVNGIRNLRRDLVEMKTSINFDNKLQYNFVKLVIAFVRNNMMYGSYSAFRMEFGQGLITCANKYKIKELDMIGNDFKDIGLHWQKLFRILTSIIHDKGIFNDKYNNVINLIDEISIREEKQFKYINKILFI